MAYISSMVYIYIYIGLANAAAKADYFIFRPSFKNCRCLKRMNAILFSILIPFRTKYSQRQALKHKIVQWFATSKAMKGCLKKKKKSIAKHRRGVIIYSSRFYSIEDLKLYFELN